MGLARGGETELTPAHERFRKVLPLAFADGEVRLSPVGNWNSAGGRSCGVQFFHWILPGILQDRGTFWPPPPPATNEAHCEGVGAAEDSLRMVGYEGICNGFRDATVFLGGGELGRPLPRNKTHKLHVRRRTQVHPRTKPRLPDEKFCS